MFFERRTEQDETQGWRQPAWKAPPQELGHLVALNRTLARSERATLNLTAAHVFSTGAMLWVYAHCRRSELSEDEWILLQFSGHTGPVGRTGPNEPAPPDRVLRFGVAYPDGRTATTIDDLPTTSQTDRPSPVLHRKSQHADQTGPTHRALWICLWLWPLPPPQSIELVLEWPLAAIPQTSVELDGAELTRNASHAVPAWPDS